MFYKEKINFGLRFKCNGIHTFFMYQNIDVVLCDKHNKILYYYPEVKKNKVILPKKNVYYTYELPPLYFDIKVGSYITIKKAK